MEPQYVAAKFQANPSLLSRQLWETFAVAQQCEEVHVADRIAAVFLSMFPRYHSVIQSTCPSSTWKTAAVAATAGSASAQQQPSSRRHHLVSLALSCPDDALRLLEVKVPFPPIVLPPGWLSQSLRSEGDAGRTIPGGGVPDRLGFGLAQEKSVRRVWDRKSWLIRSSGKGKLVRKRSPRRSQRSNSNNQREESTASLQEPATEWQHLLRACIGSEAPGGGAAGTVMGLASRAAAPTTSWALPLMVDSVHVLRSASASTATSADGAAHDGRFQMPTSRRRANKTVSWIGEGPHAVHIMVRNPLPVAVDVTISVRLSSDTSAGAAGEDDGEDDGAPSRCWESQCMEAHLRARETTAVRCTFAPSGEEDAMDSLRIDSCTCAWGQRATSWLLPLPKVRLSIRFDPNPVVSQVSCDGQGKRIVISFFLAGPSAVHFVEACRGK